MEDKTGEGRRSFTETLHLIERQSLLAEPLHLASLQAFFSEWDVSHLCLFPDIDLESFPMRFSEFKSLTESHLLDAVEWIQFDWLYKVTAFPIIHSTD